MRGPVAVLLVCLMGVQPTAQMAGQGGTTDQPASARFDALGVSFERIKRELRIQPGHAVQRHLSTEARLLR